MDCYQFIIPHNVHSGCPNFAATAPSRRSFWLERRQIFVPIRALWHGSPSDIWSRSLQRKQRCLLLPSAHENSQSVRPFPGYELMSHNRKVLIHYRKYSQEVMTLHIATCRKYLLLVTVEIALQDLSFQIQQGIEQVFRELVDIGVKKVGL